MNPVSARTAAHATAGRPLRVGIVAGEASGDLLGAHLIQALRKHDAGLEFFGIAGPKMIAAGAKALFPMEKLAVRGYVEVLRHYREIVGIRAQLIEKFLADPPDLFIGIDAPDFNLDLEIALKNGGIKTVHYVSPSIWAWRKDRIKKIGKAVDHVLVIFPFEKKIYDDAGIAATYVGHPLADMLPAEPDRAAARETLKVRPHETVIAMMPGSRQSELHYMAELFVRTAKEIHRKRPDVRFLVPLVSRETRARFELAMYRHDARDLPITVLFGHAHAAVTAANVVLVASGTATLEAALLKRPMVITYKMSPLTYRMMVRKALLPYVGLPNILAGRFIVPELLQRDATPENLCHALLNLVGDQEVLKRTEEALGALQSALRQNASERLGEALLPLLRAGGKGS